MVAFAAHAVGLSSLESIAEKVTNPGLYAEMPLKFESEYEQMTEMMSRLHLSLVPCFVLFGREMIPDLFRDRRCCGARGKKGGREWM